LFSVVQGGVKAIDWVANNHQNLNIWEHQPDIG
jgi:hypothetical protein